MFAPDYREYCKDNRWWTHLDKDKMTAHVIIDRYDAEADDCIEEKRDVKVRMEVCPACDGRGSYVNPSIDSHGISYEEFDEDPDFANDYLSGRYNITCEECNGATVVPVCLDKEVNEWLMQAGLERAETRAEYAAERRIGA